MICTVELFGIEIGTFIQVACTLTAAAVYVCDALTGTRNSGVRWARPWDRREMLVPNDEILRHILRGIPQPKTFFRALLTIGCSWDPTRTGTYMYI